MAAIYVGCSLELALANEAADRLMVHNLLAAHACCELGITEALQALAARTGDADLGKGAICVMFWVSLAMIVTAGVGALLGTGV